MARRGAPFPHWGPWALLHTVDSPGRGSGGAGEAATAAGADTRFNRALLCAAHGVAAGPVGHPPLAADRWNRAVAELRGYVDADWLVHLTSLARRSCRVARRLGSAARPRSRTPCAGSPPTPRLPWPPPPSPPPAAPCCATPAVRFPAAVAARRRSRRPWSRPGSAAARPTSCACCAPPVQPRHRRGAGALAPHRREARGQPAPQDRGDRPGRCCPHSPHRCWAPEARDTDRVCGCCGPLTAGPPPLTRDRRPAHPGSDASEGALEEEPWTPYWASRSRPPPTPT